MSVSGHQWYTTGKLPLEALWLLAVCRHTEQLGVMASDNDRRIASGIHLHPHLTLCRLNGQEGCHRMTGDFASEAKFDLSANGLAVFEALRSFKDELPMPKVDRYNFSSKTVQRYRTSDGRSVFRQKLGKVEDTHGRCGKLSTVATHRDVVAAGHVDTITTHAKPTELPPGCAAYRRCSRRRDNRNSTPGIEQEDLPFSVEVSLE